MTYCQVSNSQLETAIILDHPSCLVTYIKVVLLGWSLDLKWAVENWPQNKKVDDDEVLSVELLQYNDVMVFQI